MKVMTDETWLFGVLRDLIRDDPFAATLWQIHLDVKRTGVNQGLRSGIFRSDYMVHDSNSGHGIKQVEFNTFSVAGGVHANRAADMHAHLDRTREPSAGGNGLRTQDNGTTAGLVSGLSTFYHHATNTNGELRKCVLMVVDPFNYNIADERPLEYGLWEKKIPTYRCIWQEVLDRTTLSSSNELRYKPHICSAPLEVAVVYYRAGYQAQEYDERGIETRLRLETSTAIKCPDVLGHLATFKRVQQALTVPETLERFLNAEMASLVRQTFMPMFVLDDSETGLQARAVAQDPARVVNYVLKPNLEGGGHNIYRSAIPDFLETLPEEQWHKYVLMELINSAPQEGVLMTPKELYQGPVVSELGVFGCCLWRDGSVLVNETAGWSFKTKRADIDEMSVAKGFGCFDCPKLVD